MNERIKKVRKTFDLTQQEFGERIGIKRNSVALIENGRNTSDQTIFAICREFNIREEWLRYGTGEMFVPAPNNALDALAAEYHLDQGAYIAIEKFVKLKPDIQQEILNYFTEVAKALDDVPAATSGEPTDSHSEASNHPLSAEEEAEIEAEVEDYRQQLELERRVAEKSLALPKEKEA